MLERGIETESPPFPSACIEFNFPLMVFGKFLQHSGTFIWKGSIELTVKIVIGCLSFALKRTVAFVWALRRRQSNRH